MVAEWGMDATMATAVEGAVQPSGETAATSKARSGCVLAAAGLAVAQGVLVRLEPGDWDCPVCRGYESV